MNLKVKTNSFGDSSTNNVSFSNSSLLGSSRKRLMNLNAQDNLVIFILFITLIIAIACILTSISINQGRNTAKTFNKDIDAHEDSICVSKTTLNTSQDDGWEDESIVAKENIPHILRLNERLNGYKYINHSKTIKT